MVNLIPSWLLLAEINSTVHVALPKPPINQFKPVQQSRQQTLRAYCPNIFNVSQALHFHIGEEENDGTEVQRPYYISIAMNVGNEIRYSTNSPGTVYLKFLKPLFENVKKC